MKSKKTFYSEICKKSKDCMKAMMEIDRQIKEIEDKRELKIYRDSALNDMSRELKYETSNLLDEHNNEIKKMCDAYINELRDAQGLDGSQIDEDIMKVLSAPVNLTKQDIKTLLNKCNSNATMARIVLRYAKEHNIECGMMLNDPLDKTIAAVDSLPYTVSVATKWYNQEQVYDELLGDGSDISNFFNEG